ncbi:mechanosensitive ion channel family protein [bacterium]|nr:mechanosensitive ion channel family protein [bacterium]
MGLGKQVIGFLQDNLHQIIPKGGGILLITLLLWVVLRLARVFIYRFTLPLEKREDPSSVGRVKTIRGLLGSLASFIIGFIWLLMVLDILGIKTTAILGAAGVVGVAVGLGTQTFIRDAFFGFLIVIEDQFREGDLVTIGGITGAVEQITFRTTKIRGDDGKLYIISNSSITQVCNHSRGGLVIFQEVAFPNHLGEENLVKVLKEVGDRLSKTLGDSLVSYPKLDNIVSFDAQKTVFRISVSIRPAARKEGERLFRETLRDVLLEKGLI